MELLNISSGIVARSPQNNMEGTVQTLTESCGFLQNLFNLAVTLQYQPCISVAILTNSFGITTLAAQMADEA